MLSKQPLLSYVISVKNRSAFLREALQSLLNQTEERWEAIIVDDYSDEHIAEVVDSFQDERLRYVRNEGNPGISAARNLGNSLAEARIIAVADSDDINLPRRTEVTLAYFREHPETDVFYGNMCIFNDGEFNFTQYKTFSGYNRAMLYEVNFIPHPTSAYRKSIAKNFPYDESLQSAVDYNLFLTLTDHNCIFGYTEEPLILYRRHLDQISTDPERQKTQAENAKKLIERHKPHQFNSSAHV